MAGLGAAQVDASFESTAQQTPSNNSTVQHERPSDASGSGDSQRVSQWLEGRLTSQLQKSTINISQGQYDQARSVLGDDYDSRLGQYVDVAGETETQADDRASEPYESVKETQREYANETQNYRETYDEYQRARAAGNTTAARQAARDLEDSSERLQRLNESLQRDYERISNLTGTDTGTAQQSIAATTVNFTTQQASVRAQTFVETRLTVRTNDSTVAFDDPAAVEGRIRLANGTALRNERGRLVVGDRAYPIRTDDEGRFRVVYRPISVSVNATSVPVRFRPTTTSPYLGAAANISVAVAQVTPHIEITNGQTRGGYRDRLTTTAVATVDDRPVPSLPIRVRLGGAVVSARTDRAGRVTLSPQVPARLSAGEHSLTVSHARTAVAVGPNVTTRTVTITETATNLTVSATTDGVLRVQGRLTTASGGGIPDQPVQLRIGGTERAIETNATGWYRLTAGNVSAFTTSDNATVAVTARFAGEETNLQPSQARTSLAVQGAATGDSGPSTLLILGGLAVGVLLTAGVIGWSRRGTDAASGGPEPAPDDPATAATPSPDDQSRQWLARARSALEADDHERAIVTAYGAVRRRIEQEGSVEPTLTHREFLAAAEGPLSPDERVALSTVARTYEEAVFRGVVAGAAATEALEAAAELLPDSAEPSD